jgi:FKBP-type peptidyl-prolyl cis-trans isomerase FkpA
LYQLIIERNKMNIRNFVLAAIAGTMILSTSSCLKDDTAAQRAEEMNVLKEYIKANNITVTPTPSGLYYIETLAGTGDSAKLKNWMEINYTGRLLSNNSIVMTSDMQVAKDNGLFQTGIYYGPTRLLLGYISYAGLNEGISMMKEGGKARLIFPSNLGLGGQSSSYIPAYSSLIFDVELVKVIPDIKSYENGLMMQYLQANEISTDSTSSGIYFKETTPGAGNLPVDGDQVTTTYTGKFLNGTVFDGSGKSFAFNVGSEAVIPGFEAAVKLLRKGGSATIVIPYYYAYGEYGRVDANYRNVIPPFTTLVFDINVINIAKK